MTKVKWKMTRLQATMYDNYYTHFYFMMLSIIF